MIQQRVRPWFTRTVYDRIENLGRKKQLIPLIKQRQMDCFPQKLELTYISADHADSWVKLFPRKVQVRESRTNDTQVPNKVDTSIFLSRAKSQTSVRPEVTIKSPQMVVSFPNSKSS